MWTFQKERRISRSTSFDSFKGTPCYDHRSRKASRPQWAAGDVAAFISRSGFTSGGQRARRASSVGSGGPMKTDEQVAGILGELRALGSAKDRAGMARYGINVENAFGVSVYELRKIARRLGAGHELALALWRTGNHEARLLACFVDDPAAGTEKQVEAGGRGFGSWDL